MNRQILNLGQVVPRETCEDLVRLISATGINALLHVELWDLFALVARELADRGHLKAGLVARDAAWCWNTQPGGTGWPLHRDDPNHADHLTAWVALVDIGPRNGAIRWSPLEATRAEHVVSSLEVAPARAGDVLLWDHATWHCGGRVLAGELPRVAAAIEFGRPDVKPGPVDLDVMRQSAVARAAAAQRYLASYAHLIRAARDLTRAVGA